MRIKCQIESICHEWIFKHVHTCLQLTECIINHSMEMDSDCESDQLLVHALHLDHVSKAGHEDFDMDVPPTTGSEYLRRVQREAKQCPAIVVADIDTSAFKGKQTIKVHASSGCYPAPPGYAPSEGWQRDQAMKFSQVRQQFARNKALRKKQSDLKKPILPKSEDYEGWCRLCFGRLKPKGANYMTKSVDEMADPNSSSDEGTPPLLNIIANLDQVTVLHLLEYHINWFEATGFTTEQGRWFYALLACLEKPLSPEACSLIRALARNCAVLRATLESADDQTLIQLNLIICLIARYFDQVDLL